MSKTKPTSSIIQTQPYIFIDTCIIQDAGSSIRSKSEIVLGFLEKLVKEGFNLSISEFSIYENLQGLWGQRVKQATNILYHDEKVDNVSDGDKIIAATAILENGFVLTRNHKDFPVPFFTTEKSVPLTYRNGNHQTTLDLAIYKPNLELINRRLVEKNNS
jgi:hypothetical protein